MKKKSRQQTWAELRLAEGVCATCGGPLLSKWYCQKHTESVRDNARARYRKRVGKPVNGPLANSGRKRTEEVEK